MTPLVLAIGSILAFLVALGSTLGIFIISQRRGQAATMVKAISTAATVLSVPGVILAFAGDVLEPMTRLALSYVGLAAGVVALTLGGMYMLRSRQPSHQLPCPRCQKSLDPSWDRCPYCGYSFALPNPPDRLDAPLVGASPSAEFEMMRLNDSPFGAAFGEAVPPPGAMAEAVDANRSTKVLRSQTPGHYAWLVIVNGGPIGHEFLLREEIVIGRDGSRCDIVLEDVGVSSLHAKIRLVDGHFVLNDLASTNGTHVNGAAALQHTLRDKDRVKVGDTQLVFIHVRETASAERMNVNGQL